MCLLIELNIVNCHNVDVTYVIWSWIIYMYIKLMYRVTTHIVAMYVIVKIFKVIEYRPVYNFPVSWKL